MTCNVILTSKNGRFFARVAEFPNCRAEAESRDQALALIQTRLEEIVKYSEIVQLEIPNLEKKFDKFARSEKQNDQAKLPNLVRVDAPIAANDKTVHLETPWEYYGIFKDDPTLWPMMEEIERRRDRHVVYPKRKRKNRKTA